MQKRFGNQTDSFELCSPWACDALFNVQIQPEPFASMDTVAEANDRATLIQKGVQVMLAGPWSERNYEECLQHANEDMSVSNIMCALGLPGEHLYRREKKERQRLCRLLNATIPHAA